ncbi:hypothetical protein AB8O64_13685 [Streptomyces sp. QH1-20]|uniref:hypothetical protein n=1 Tax=Streptomyces sp. QH1-20 TaxID=3240934 RepID=UPI003514E242
MIDVIRLVISGVIASTEAWSSVNALVRALRSMLAPEPACGAAATVGVCGAVAAVAVVPVAPMRSAAQAVVAATARGLRILMVSYPFFCMTFQSFSAALPLGSLVDVTRGGAKKH